MSNKIKNVRYNNPSLLPIGNYDIDIISPFHIEIANTGSYSKSSNWSIVSKNKKKNKKDMIIFDLVTLKKILDKTKQYPKLKKNEVATLCQIILNEDTIQVWGDIVKVKKVK